MKFINNYLKKNIFIGFVILVSINIFLYLIARIGTNWFWLWLIILLPILWIFGKIRLRTFRFAKGLAGENDINLVLDQLGSDFVCLKNGLCTDRGNIDKIVIGSTGVWVLEVKSYSGAFSFDGSQLLRNGKSMDKDFLKQTYAEAKTLQEIIKSKAEIDIPVNPVLVFSNKYAKVRFGFKTIKGVYVIGKEWLIRLVTTESNSSLDKETIIKINSVLN